MMKFDLNKIKERIAKEKEQQDAIKNKKKEKDITKDILLKVATGGDHKFRAVPYIHNADYLENPFPARFYHFGLPGQSIFYCPQKNDGEKCAVCDFVWSQMKELKGTEEAKVWKGFLPKRRILIPGLVRQRENEGIKFFCLSTWEEKMSDHHKKLYKYFQDADTFDFLDPENGFDLILTYDEYTAEQSKRFFGAKVGFSDLELARGRSPISSNPQETWSELEANMPNVDVDIPKYEKKTSEDALEVVKNWATEQAKRDKWNNKGKPVDESKDDDGEVVQNTKEEQVKEEDKPVVVEKTQDKSEDSPDARKRRVLAALKQASNKG